MQVSLRRQLKKARDTAGQHNFSDIFTIANASCIALGIFAPTEVAAQLPVYTMYLVEESVLLDNLDMRGNIDGGLTAIALAWCNGLACDAGSGRWLLSDVDVSLRYHVIVLPTDYIANGSPAQSITWMTQAFSDPGAVCIWQCNRLQHRYMWLSLPG